MPRHLVTVDELDSEVLAAHFRPVGDLARIDIAKLLGREVLDGVVRVHDDGDAVVRDRDGGEAQLLLFFVKTARGGRDLRRPIGDGLDASTGAQAGDENAEPRLLGVGFSGDLGDGQAGGRTRHRDLAIRGTGRACRD